jgi:hypothetical protein
MLRRERVLELHSLLRLTARADRNIFGQSLSSRKILGFKD